MRLIKRRRRSLSYRFLFIGITVGRILVLLPSNYGDFTSLAKCVLSTLLVFAGVLSIESIIGYFRPITLEVDLDAPTREAYKIELSDNIRLTYDENFVVNQLIVGRRIFFDDPDAEYVYLKINGLELAVNFKMATEIEKNLQVTRTRTYGLVTI